MTANARKLIKDNSGVAMIYSLVIGIVVSIFAVMLLMVAYSLFAQSSRQTGQTQCRIMADTFAESFAQELLDEESEVHQYVCKRYSGEITPQWVGYNEKSVSPDAIIELSYKPNDINYEIEIKLTYDVVESSGDDEDDDDGEIIDDDNDPDNIQSDPGVPGGGSATSLADEVIVNAEVTCYKGGTQGIAIQSYTVNQKCKVKMNGENS